MKKTVYFVRHGESEANVDMLWCGWTDSKLTKKGKEQAVEAAKKFEAAEYESIEKIFCSDLVRARDTAFEINKVLNKPIEISEKLRETNFGDLEGFNFTQIVETGVFDLNRSRDREANVYFPNGESVFSMTQRFTYKINEILQEHDTVLVVAHGMAIAAAVAYFAFNDVKLMNRFVFENAKINKLVFTEDKTYIEMVNG